MIFLIWWILLLTILVGALAISFYRLYVQAEKAQKTAFTGEVLKVGREIAEKFNDRINEEFMSDTALVSFSESADSPDTHTLLVMNDGVPSALLTQTVTEYQGNLIILKQDTSYFHSDDSTKIVVLDTVATGHSLYTDSNINRIDNRDFTDIVRKTLHEYGMDIAFEYGIFNFPKDHFVIRSKSMDKNIVDKAYIFALQTNNTEVYTHYLILNFPSERAFFLKKMFPIVLPIAGIVVLLSLLMIIMLITLTQQTRNQEVKNDFINNMTHEFKTPISTISLACEAMEDDSIQTDADTRKAYVSMIRAENERLQKMVTKILQLAQL